MDFIKMMQEACTEKETQGKAKTAAFYRTATRHFTQYLVNYQQITRIDVSRITHQLIIQYEQYLIDQCGVTRNTSSAYMRPLKTTYNNAVRLSICTNRYPFKSVFTGIDKTNKRAISQHIIGQLINIDLHNRPELALSRDLFLFSFFTRGMAFIDIANLTHKHIVNGRIEYSRHKTHKQQSIRIETPIEKIIKRYADKERKHIFPLFDDDTFTQKKYDSALRLHNLHLHRISAMLRLSLPLTSYVARHSWATQAHHKHVPIKVISEALGHSKEETTIIYLASLNHRQVDKANNTILQGYKKFFDAK
ncbi:MAG: site-specific integrase [Bacteroidaceae bacterium]|nr:site-specific integrase [Bacteroidales bacterium]MBQ2979674.1 site-specific integrase [Bacteroidaceae bacterium]